MHVSQTIGASQDKDDRHVVDGVHAHTSTALSSCLDPQVVQILQ